jgi:hypothetical protein
VVGVTPGGRYAGEAPVDAGALYPLRDVDEDPIGLNI